MATNGIDVKDRCMAAAIRKGKQMLDARTLQRFLVGLTATTLLLAACTGGAPPAAGPSGASPVSSRVASPVASPVVFAINADPVTLDPNEQLDRTSNLVYGNIFDGLYDRDRNGTPQPSLALSYKLIDDLTWEFKLRPGVKFHNGEDFNADAVKFTYERTANPDFKTGWRNYVRPFQSAEVVDSLTVRIKTSSAFPGFLGQLAILPIVPPKYVQEKGVEAFKKNPVGTGAYKFVEWVPGTRIVLEANDQYWRGAPKVMRYIIRPIPEVSTRLAELESGGVDIAIDVQPDQADRVKSNPKTTVLGAQANRPMVLQINTRSGNPALKDKRVREALNLAIDRDLLVDKLLRGQATKLNAQAGTPAYFGYNPDLKVPSYDPAKAKRLLQDSGRLGLEIKFHTPSGRYPLDKETVEAMAAQLTEVGFRPTVIPLEVARYVQMLQTREIGDLVYIGVGSNDLDMGQGMSTFFTSKSVWSQYENPELDALLSKGLIEMDPQKRSAAYQAATTFAAQDHAGVWLWDLKYLYGASTRLKWEPRGGEYRGVWAFDIDMNR